MSEIVTVEEASRSFHRGVEEVRAIDGVTLNIERGDFVAVVGPSGSGKTTLLNLVGCVDKPTGGRVAIHGMETEDMTDKALATIRSTTIGFVFQQFFLIPTLTAVENVMVPARFCAKGDGEDPEPKARRLLDLVGLPDRADHLPSELSGGEMQRVAIARALINEPEMLLADEPTGNLDTKSAEAVAAIFEKLNSEGLTIVMVTHNADLVGNAARAVRLHDGKVVDDTRLRPVPEGDVAWSLPEAAAQPAYMPATIKKRRWGAPLTAACMGLIGAVMAVAGFMPFVGATTGYGLLEQGVFTVSVYQGNMLTQTFQGNPAMVTTGLWPLILGILLVAAAAVLLFKRQKVSAWVALAVGALGTVLAGINLAMILTRLGPNAAMGLSRTLPGYGTWVYLGVSLAAASLGLILLLRR